MKVFLRIGVRVEVITKQMRNRSLRNKLNNPKRRKINKRMA